MIPLCDSKMSVGAVCWPDYLKSRRQSKEEFFEATLALCPSVLQRLRDARRISPVFGAGNYSYSSSAAYGDKFILIGDAHTFIDPVFSTGVYLAMRSATRAADLVALRLAKGAKTSERAFRRYEKDTAQGIELFAWFIYRFNSPGIQALFLKPVDRWGIKRAIISPLAGDAFGRKRHPFTAAIVQRLFSRPQSDAMVDDAKPQPAPQKRRPRTGTSGSAKDWRGARRTGLNLCRGHAGAKRGRDDPSAGRGRAQVDPARHRH